MEDSSLVGVVDGGGDVLDQARGLLGSHGVLADPRGQILSLDVLHGDVAVALVVPDFEHLRREIGAEGLSEASDGELAKSPEVHEFLMKRIAGRSGELASYERIKKIAVLDEALTEEKGEVTPTMKVKRDSVTRKYRSRLDELYDG